MRKFLLPVLVLVWVAPARAAAQESCANTLVFTIPGVTWQDVEDERPPEIVRAIGDGAAATLALRTTEPVTDYASGFLTIGTGSRANASAVAGGPASSEGLATTPETDNEQSETSSTVGGFVEIRELAEDAGYGAAPGSLASALDPPVVAIGNSDPGKPVPTPYGYGRYALLSAMDESGVVQRSFTGMGVVKDDASAPFGLRSDPAAIVEVTESTFAADPCSVAVVDPGDLIRADIASAVAQQELIDERTRSIDTADALLGELRALLDEDDLLLIATPTSPRWDRRTHLGVAIAVGPGFTAGSTMRSASTNLNGVVTLPDIAPTILAHQGVEEPPEMLGRPWLPATSTGDDRISSLAKFARESVYAHHTNATLSTAFVLTQAAFYAFAIAILWAREERSKQPHWLLRLLELSALSVVAFPLASYLATPLEAHTLRLPLFAATMLAIDAALLAVVWFLVKAPLDRLLALVGATYALVVVDQFFGGPLQMNAVWGIDPIVAGRFSGLGNISFAILGTTGLLTGALLFRRFEGRGWVFAAAVAIFALTIVVDGAPNLGSDVGGVLALVPALGLTFLILIGRRPSGKTIAILALGAIVAVAAFLIVDLAQPPESRTHLARFFEDVRDRGVDAFTDVIWRKARANLRLFRSSVWTYLVPVALGLLAYLVLRPRGAWRRLAGREPKLRAALVGGILVGVFGFVVNDSGIVIPAMALSYLVPLALVFHLTAAEPEP